MQKPQEVNPAAASPERFQWSQLLAGDDEAYAQNLRAIGCPESTIRDLITAAIGHRFDQKRQEIVLANKQGRVDTATMQSAIAQSWQEQNHVVNGLPGGTRSETPQASGASGSAVAATGSTPSSVAAQVGTTGTLPTMRANPTGSVPAYPNIHMPLALSDPPESLGLSETQKSAVVQVGNNFTDAVAKSHLDPSDPAYHQLWQNSQQNADDMLRAKIGQDAFVKWQLQNRQRVTN